MTDKIRKDTAGYCPKCDTIDAVTTPSIEFVSGDYIRVHHVCGNCGEEWDEYYYAQYTGYAHNGIDYDDTGFTEEENKAFTKCEEEFSTFCMTNNCDNCEYVNSVDCRVAYFNDHYTAPDFSNYPDPEEDID